MSSNRLARIAARVAAVHSSGDPATNGYSLTVEKLNEPIDPSTTLPEENSHVLSVNGTIDGQQISGKVTVHLDENGEFDGWAYGPAPNTPDISMEGGELEQTVLDCCAKELGIS